MCIYIWYRSKSYPYHPCKVYLPLFTHMLAYFSNGKCIGICIRHAFFWGLQQPQLCFVCCQSCGAWIRSHDVSSQPSDFPRRCREVSLEIAQWWSGGKNLWCSGVWFFCWSSISRWWFQLLFDFTSIWGRCPIWLICFQMGWFNHQLDYNRMFLIFSLLVSVSCSICMNYFVVS